MGGDRSEVIRLATQWLEDALRRKHGLPDLEVRWDPDASSFQVSHGIDLPDRNLAQAIRQAIVAKVREAERDVLYDEFEQQIGELVPGTVVRANDDGVVDLVV